MGTAERAVRVGRSPVYRGERLNQQLYNIGETTELGSENTGRHVTHRFPFYSFLNLYLMHSTTLFG